MPDFQNKPENISFKDGEESENGLKNVMRRSKEDSQSCPLHRRLSGLRTKGEKNGHHLRGLLGQYPKGELGICQNKKIKGTFSKETEDLGYYFDYELQGGHSGGSSRVGDRWEQGQKILTALRRLDVRDKTCYRNLGLWMLPNINRDK